MGSSPTSLPCILLTGALGSGKTTILQDLMRRGDMAGTVLIVNEYGEVGLDHLLVSTAVETTLLMDNGCMCCSLRGDVVDTILGLFSAVERGELPPFRRILIETTGLADPVPIVRDITLDPALAGKVHLGAVCTVVDGLLGPGRDAVGENQVAQADLCILSKDDLADELELDLIRERTQALNPVCRLYLKARDGLPTTQALETTHDKVAEASETGHGKGHAHHSHASVHGGVASWSIETTQPLDWSRVRQWLDHIYSLHAARMLRMKGILAIDPAQDQSLGQSLAQDQSQGLLVQAVGPVVSPPKRIDVARADRATSRLVLIFRDLDARAIAESFVAITNHDPEKER